MQEEKRLWSGVSCDWAMRQVLLQPMCVLPPATRATATQGKATSTIPCTQRVAVCVLCAGHNPSLDKLDSLDELNAMLASHNSTPSKKGKRGGGRTMLSDPRLDPDIDPKKARRIFANRCVLTLTLPHQAAT